MGKGDARRPSAITDAERRRRWKMAFHAPQRAGESLDDFHAPQRAGESLDDFQDRTGKSTSAEPPQRDFELRRAESFRGEITG